MYRILRFALLALVLTTTALPNSAQAEMKALIVDGQNNHSAWPKTTFMMKSYLEETGLFSVDIARTKFTWRGDNLLKEFPLPGVETTIVQKAKTDPDFAPDFSKYDVVVSNYNGAPWPEETQTAFVNYISNGGALVVVHAADNAFSKWPEYNEMIGLGGWGGRNEKSGPYVYFKDGKIVQDTSKGGGGHHGSQHPFSVVVRDRQHPITKGMPAEWMHTKDELYDKLRGPAKNMNVLATAYASEDHRGSGRHEPMLFTVTYGKGRIFHTPMGHADYSQECVGFIVTLQRGTEWAATGKVTQEIPKDFPGADRLSKRSYGQKAKKAAALVRPLK